MNATDDIEPPAAAPYAFRPAKRIQRLMAFDALRLLRVFHSLEDYVYLGFGSWEFVDFRLIRRELGVQRMVSIERDTNAKDRYTFNRPFADVDLQFGLSSDVLADLDLNDPTIAWLDYVSKVDGTVLADLRLLCEELPAGSAVLITVNAKPDKVDHRRDALIGRVGVDLIPPGTDEDALGGAGLATVQRQILHQEAIRAAQQRPDPIDVEQILHIRYRDGTPMLTWGAVLVDDASRDRFQSAPFARLEQYRDGADAIDVAVPVLSLKEAIFLNESIAAGEPLSVPGLGSSETNAYHRLHRWYPPLPETL